MHIENNDVNIKWWWAGPDVSKQEKEDTEILGRSSV